MKQEHRICALCRHLRVEAQGQEFPGIKDTEFTVYRCGVFGWTTRENPLMETADEARAKFAAQQPFECERWEEWKPE